QLRPEVARLQRLYVVLDRTLAVVAVVVDDHRDLLDHPDSDRHERHRLADDALAVEDVEQMGRSVAVGSAPRHDKIPSCSRISPLYGGVNAVMSVTNAPAGQQHRLSPTQWGRGAFCVCFTGCRSGSSG